MKSTFLDYSFFNIGDSSEMEYSGENNKSLLIVLQENEEREEELKLFLAKILTAIKYDINKDVYLVTLNHEKGISLSTICQKSNSTLAIVFGYKPTQLGIYAKLRNYVFTEINNISFLFCDSLKEISKQNNLKAALWDALKNKLL